jgi:Tfp pilus assembly protein PilO
MKLSPRDQLIAVAVVFAIGIIALFAVLVFPMFGKLKALDAQIADATSQVSMAQAKLARRQDIKSNASETGATLLKLANAVPENPELPALLIDLQDAAYDSDVQILTVTPGTPAARSGVLAVPMSLHILGTWENTIGYMRGLSKLTRQLRIVSFSSIRSDVAAVEHDIAPYSPGTDLILEAYVLPAGSVTVSSTPAPAAPAAQKP